MAALIGDVFTDSSRFHNMIGGVGLQHAHDSRYHHPVSRSRDRETPPSSQPRTATTPTQRYARRNDRENAATEAPYKALASTGEATHIPSPPSSSSPSRTSAGARPQHGTSPRYMASATPDPSAPALVASSVTSTSTESSTSTITTATPAQPFSQQIPSPAWDGRPQWMASSSNPTSDARSPAPTQTTVRVRDLAHIQSLARADLISGDGPGILNDPPLQAMKYEISAMPIADIIEMVAALLTKITTTNDLQHDALNRNAAHIKQAQAAASRSDDAGSGGSGDHSSPLSSSVLAFHGKNVPAITILSYLSRINKYCPTTYEVFLSLLVYFDRMTERVNDLVVKSEEARRQQQPRASQARPLAGADVDTVMRDGGDDDDDGNESEGSGEIDSDLADDDDDDESEGSQPTARVREAGGAAVTVPPTQPTAPPVSQATYFVVDSFNIHRLIIAGVTCASKFFSDVFYTNSRYAKVGGLPLGELNHLELQFLLLNDPSAPRQLAFR
ncbi:cyclin-domain-containing protein [Phialemonium atrogriseum]|uniref:Cyclin-domain-containing protein n=1 Tax=Phialemonium atrogriseum TaxID=1093897 RepID=A0AAJ0C652_9PEZI|nr:cyclin-domain-containing protein [Phialemonium atrogriseum]KAK1770192.1 cyclin-domain-containing protein [Phialemonium atrogriseum]